MNVKDNMIIRKFFITLVCVTISVMTLLGQTREEFSFQRSSDPFKSIEIFPNPATDYISVKFERPMASKARISVHNVIGNTMELESEIVNEHEVKIKVKDLATGYYLVSVKDENLNAGRTFKFLKR